MADYTTTLGLSDEQFRRGWRSAERTARRSQRRMEDDARSSGARISRSFSETTRTIVGTAAISGAMRGVVEITRDYAETNSYARRGVDELGTSVGRLRHAVGRDLALAMGQGSDSVGGFFDLIGRHREALTNFLGDAIRSHNTLSNQFGNAAGAVEAMREMERQDILFRQSAAVQAAARASQSRIASIEGRSFDSAALETEIRLKERLAKIEEDRAALWAKLSGQGLASSSDAVAGMNAGQDRLRAMASAERDAQQRSIAERRGDASRLFGIDARIAGARRDGDDTSLARLRTERDAEVARQGAFRTARGLGYSESDARGYGNEAARGVFAQSERDTQREAEDARRVVQDRMNELRIGRLIAEDKREAANDLREQLEIQQLILDVSRMTAVSEEERARAIAQGTEDIRGRYDQERERIREDRNREAERKRDAERSAQERLVGLRISSLEARGQQSQADELRKQQEIREYERSVREDELLSEQTKNELIAEGTRLIGERFDAERRRDPTVRGLAPGSSAVASQFFGAGVIGADEPLDAITMRTQRRERGRARMLASRGLTDHRGKDRGESKDMEEIKNAVLQMAQDVLRMAGG